MKVRKVPQVVIKELVRSGYSVAYINERYHTQGYWGEQGGWRVGKVYRVYNPNMNRAFKVYVSQDKPFCLYVL